MPDFVTWQKELAAFGRRWRAADQRGEATAGQSETQPTGGGVGTRFWRTGSVTGEGAVGRRGKERSVLPGGGNRIGEGPEVRAGWRVR